MILEFISAGKIVNTHGIRGEVKILPDGMEAEQLYRCKTLYIDGKPVIPKARRIHKECLLVSLPGVEDMNTALTLKNKSVSVRRSDIVLPDGQFFDEELLGLQAVDAETQTSLGTLAEILTYPAHKIYAIRDGGKELLVPAVPAFIQQVDLEQNKIYIHVWEGLA